MEQKSKKREMETIVDPLISEIERWKVWILVGGFVVGVVALFWFL